MSPILLLLELVYSDDEVDGLMTDCVESKFVGGKLFVLAGIDLDAATVEVATKNRLLVSFMYFRVMNFARQ